MDTVKDEDSISCPGLYSDELCRDAWVMMSCLANSAKKMTSVKSMHYIGLEFIKPIWEPKENAAAAAWLVVFNHAISYITVKTHVGSARDTELYRKVLQFSLKSLICNTVALLRRFIHRGGFSCQIPKSIVGRRPWLSFGCVQAMASQSCFQTDVSSWKFNEESVSKKVPFTRATEDTN